jgi:hypothetical protein
MSQEPPQSPVRELIFVAGKPGISQVAFASLLALMIGVGMTQTSGSSDLVIIVLFFMLIFVIARATKRWIVRIDADACRLIIMSRLFRVWPTFTAHFSFEECTKVWAEEDVVGDGERRISVVFELGERGVHVAPVDTASLSDAAKLADQISALTGIVRSPDRFPS